MFADSTVSPAGHLLLGLSFAWLAWGVVAWLVAGSMAGWLAATYLKGFGSTKGADVSAGLIGAVAGGLLVSLRHDGMSGVWGSFNVAAVAACMAIVVFRMVSAPKGVDRPAEGRTRG